MACIRGNSVFSRSLCGHYKHLSRRFAEATVVTALAWVVFEEKAPAWLAVVARSDVLFLCSPSGTHLEIVLHCAVNAWPISLSSAGRQGLLLQGRTSPSTLFRMTHPLKIPVSVRISDHSPPIMCGDNKMQDDLEQIIFVSKHISPLIVTYCIKHLVHRLRCLSTSAPYEMFRVPFTIADTMHSTQDFNSQADISTDVGDTINESQDKLRRNAPLDCTALEAPCAASRVFHMDTENCTEARMGFLCLVMHIPAPEHASK